MKKSYIKPIIEVVVSIAEMPLLIGSNLDHADSKVNHFGDEASEEDSNDPGSDPFWGKSAW
jgi:hypothetical protein